MRLSVPLSHDNFNFNGEKVAKDTVPSTCFRTTTKLVPLLSGIA